MKTWNAEEAAAFLVHARTDRLYAAWLLALDDPTDDPGGWAPPPLHSR